MRERKSNMLGDIVRMEAVNAGQNIGAGYIDQDDFYPADGVGSDDLDTIDMVYDNSTNDLSPSADFFDGDYQNSYADGDEDDDDYDDFDDDDDYEDFDDEDDDYDDFDDEDDDYEDFDDEDDEEDDDYDSLNGYGNPYDSEAEWEDFDGGDDLDMEESTGSYNDLGAGGFDFFEGGDPELDVDYNNFDSDTYSDARGRRKKRNSIGLGRSLKNAVDTRFSEEGQQRAENRREDRRTSRAENRADRKEKRTSRRDSRLERREDRRADRTEKRDTRKEDRKDRREERQGLRSKKKLAKIGEVESRNEATRALATPQADVSLTQVATDLTKKADLPKKGLSTGAIVGISLGALAVVGTALFFILKKK
jgi:DNA-directed RNA polymerase subunit delta